jgi:dienelactone hydrolase
MKLRDYLEMDAPSARFDDLVFLTHRWKEYSYRGLAEDSAAFDRLMSTETAACDGAAPTAGRFPLVVYSAGWFNRSPDNTVLAEYLAGHGFVVAAVPQLNPGLWTFDFTSDAPAFENQIRDLEEAIAVLREDPMVDRRRIAAMG